MAVSAADPDVAAPIEELTKQHGAAILLSEETRRPIAGGFEFAPAGAAPVRGKTDPIAIYVPQRVPTGLG